MQKNGSNIVQINRKTMFTVMVDPLPNPSEDGNDLVTGRICSEHLRALQVLSDLPVGL